LPGNGRMGYEFFPKDGNYLYEIAQFFPRMAVYDDVYGWQHKQFLGNGEFTLPFGNYKVAITVPADHVLGATGTLKNPGQVLTAAQQSRLDKARGSDKPVVIVTQEEAAEAEKGKAAKKKTWVFEAENVRDFAFATSRKFIWDAMAVNVEGKKVLAMSYYPKEANPLWGKYSTQAVAHTLRSYSKRTIAYPYPVAISVHGPVGGMEYPMISFNGYRPEPDGTYSEQIKYGLISVVIHEVGHNFFPMIINSDERQWTWMDEGLNSFCQYLAEQEWQRDYPSRRGEPYKIVPYMGMAQTTLEPIMTNSEQVSQLGNNAYGKPATALNILRETVMGRDLFDYAFKEYARRWAFKHPHPADFFRTMEDASGVDLDWFWRGWFYGTEPVEISLENVDWMQINSQNPDKEKPLAKAESEKKTISQLRNAEQIKTTVVDQNPELKDFYNTYDPYEVTAADKSRFDRYYASLSPEEKKLVDSGENFYTLTLKNNGGLVMPVILKMDFEDGTNQVLRIPAQVWRM
ncbi:MAG TPA: M1 family metallopeptidase, partial [Cytophagales bacterium]